MTDNNWKSALKLIRSNGVCWCSTGEHCLTVNWRYHSSRENSRFMTLSSTYFTTNHFVCIFPSPKGACTFCVTKGASEMSNREIVASLRDNHYSRRSVYVFGYTTSWISRISSFAIRIRRSKTWTFCRDVCPLRWVIVKKIATLRDDRHTRTHISLRVLMNHLVDHAIWTIGIYVFEFMHRQKVPYRSLDQGPGTQW